MKTTIDLPDDLVRSLKIRAAEQNRRFKDVVADLLRRGLDQEHNPEPRLAHRVELPLFEGRPALPGQELTPERIAQILDEEDARRALG